MSIASAWWAAAGTGPTDAKGALHRFLMKAAPPSSKYLGDCGDICTSAMAWASASARAWGSSIGSTSVSLSPPASIVGPLCRLPLGLPSASLLRVSVELPSRSTVTSTLLDAAYVTSPSLHRQCLAVCHASSSFLLIVLSTLVLCAAALASSSAALLAIQSTAVIGVPSDLMATPILC